MKKKIMLLLLGIFLLSFVNATIFEYDNATETAQFYEGNAQTGKQGLFASAQLLTPKVNLVGIGEEVKVFEFNITSYNQSDDLNDLFDDWDFYNIKDPDDWEVINKNVKLKYKSYYLENYTNWTESCSEGQIEGINCTMINNGEVTITKELWNPLNYELRNVTKTNYITNCTTDPCSVIPNGTTTVEEYVWTKPIESNISMLNGQTINIAGFVKTSAGEEIEFIPTIFGYEITQWATWKVSLDNGNTNYYKLDEEDTTGTGTITDYRGSSNGTNNGADNDTGVINTGYDFNTAASEYIDLNFEIPDDAEGTICTWVNPNDNDVEVFMADRTGTGEYLQITKLNTNKFSYRISESSTHTIDANASYSTGTWYHLCVLWGTGGMKFYQDTELVGVDAYTGGWTSNSNFYLGNGNGNGADVKLDEVGIWNRTLTLTEIRNLYNGGNGLQPQEAYNSWTSFLNTSMLDFYRLEEDSGTSVYSTTGNNTGTLTGSYTINVSGIQEQAFNFSNSADGGVSGMALIDNEDASMSAWVRVGDGTPTQQIWHQRSASNTNPILGCYVESDKFQVGIRADGGGTYSNAQSTTTIVPDEWYHFVCVYDRSAGTFDIYVNGIYESQATGISPTIDFNGANDGRIAKNVRVTSQTFDGDIDNFALWDRTLNQTEINYLYNGGISLNPSEAGAAPTPTTNATVTNVVFTPLNSSQLQNGYEWNSTFIQEIEYMELNFTLSDDDEQLVGDANILFTALGSNACSLGNLQNNQCYNYTDNTWINFTNGTTTATFKDEGASGDFIDCTVTQTNSSYRDYSCLIDEHYNPNVFKWYNAGFNFSDTKWQSASSQRITANNYIRIEVPTTIPLDADTYKLDLRADPLIGLTPTQPLEGYLCNSTYTTGEPEGNVNCALVTSKLPSEFQAGGTKFRGEFSNAFITGLGDIKYVVLKTDQVGTSRYYSLKTYGITNGSHSQQWDYSTDAGSTWNDLADGYESEMNINWFYDGASPTGFSFKVGIEMNDTGFIETEDNNNTWTITADQNYAPIVNIQTPIDEASVGGDEWINWTVTEPNSDSTLTNITLNGTLIQTNLNNLTTTYEWDTTAHSNGDYELAVITCENATTDLFCGNDTHQITIANDITVTLISPTNDAFYDEPQVFSTSATNALVLVNATIYTNESGTWQGYNTTSVLYNKENNVHNDSTVYTNTQSAVSELEKTYNPAGNFNLSEIRYKGRNDDSGRAATFNVNVTFEDGTTTQIGNTTGTGTAYEDFIIEYNGSKLADKIDFYSITDGAGTARLTNINISAWENSTSANVSVTRTITDYTIWNMEYCNNVGTCQMAVSNFTLQTDTVAPTINITGPTNTFFREDEQTYTINFEFTDNDAVDTCIYEYNGANNSMTCGDSSTTFTYQGGVNNILFYVNDTQGNMATLNYVFNDTIVMLNQTYDTEAVETSTSTFTAFFEYTSADWSAVSGDLYYNNSANTGTITGGGNVFSITDDITIPAISGGSAELPFYWNISLTNVTGSFYAVTTERNQTVSEVTFRECLANETAFLNFTTYDTLNPTTRVNATFKSFWQIKDSSGGGAVVNNETYQDLNENRSNWELCLFPNSTNYTVSMDAVADATSFTPTNYYLTDQEFDGTTQNINLYLLNNSDATLTEIEVVDVSYTGIPNILGFVQRYDVGTNTYYTTDMIKTSEAGSDIVYMHWYDSFYRFILTENGEVIKTTVPKKIFETPQTIQIINNQTLNWEKFGDISYSLTFNNATENFVLTYALPSAGVDEACLLVTKRNATNDYNVCNSCDTSSSGTIFCNIASEGNGTFIAKFYSTGSLGFIDSLTEYIGGVQQVRDLIGEDESTALTIIIAGVAVSFFLFSAAAGVIGILLAIALVSALGLQQFNLLAFTGIILGGVIVIWLVKR